MPKFRSSILAAALATAFASGPAAAQFSNMFFFGDSATDAGSYKPVLPPGTGRFTTNPGEVWAQMLGSRYGFAITPANQGGTDYAQGGARVTQTPGYPRQPPTGGAVPVATQVSQAVAKGIDGNALYAVAGRLQRPLHRVRPAAGRPDHVGAAAGQRRARRHAARAAGRHPEGERRELHVRHEPLRHRQGAQRHRRRPGALGADLRGHRPLQQHPQRRAQPGRRQRHSPQCGRAVQRTHLQSGGLRHHQHDGAGLRRDFVAAVHARRTWSPPTPRPPTCSPTACTRPPRGTPSSRRPSAR